MIINNYKINVFEPRFALLRVAEEWEPYDRDELGRLRDMIEKYSTPEREYKQGDEIIYRERDYHKYPAYVAVLFEENGAFKMQTFSHQKVGPIYENVLQQQDQIRKFFDEAGSEIIVLDNYFRRELPGDFDLVLSYVDKMIKTREYYEEHEERVNNYVLKYNELIDAWRSNIPRNSCLLLEKTESVARDLINDMFQLIDEVNAKAKKELECFYKPVETAEKDCIIFGLYYCFLKKGLNLGAAKWRRSNLFSAFLREMHSFLQRCPQVVENYCEYMDYPRYEREVILQVLHNEGLDRERWIFAADDLL